jgi:hypothetical protein
VSETMLTLAFDPGGSRLRRMLSRVLMEALVLTGRDRVMLMHDRPARSSILRKQMVTEANGDKIWLDFRFAGTAHKGSGKRDIISSSYV